MQGAPQHCANLVEFKLSLDQAQEDETALEEERMRGNTVLFPIRLDDAAFSVDKGRPNLLKNSRNIGDFTDWKNHDRYQQAFDHLLRDLKVG